MSLYVRDLHPMSSDFFFFNEALGQSSQSRFQLFSC